MTVDTTKKWPLVGLRASFEGFPLGTLQEWKTKDGYRIFFSWKGPCEDESSVHHGKWVVIGVKPIGKGSQSVAKTGKKPEDYRWDYFRTFTQRRSARKRATTMFWQHGGRPAK